MPPTRTRTVFQPRFRLGNQHLKFQHSVAVGVGGLGRELRQFHLQLTIVTDVKGRKSRPVTLTVVPGGPLGGVKGDRGRPHQVGGVGENRVSLIIRKGGGHQVGGRYLHRPGNGHFVGEGAAVVDGNGSG